MYLVKHVVGNFQPGEMITDVQAGANAARLVELGAIVPLGSEVPTEADFALAPEVALPIGFASEARFLALEERITALEERLKELEPIKFADRLKSLEDKAGVFYAGGPTPLIVGTGEETTGDNSTTTDADKAPKGKGK